MTGTAQQNESSVDAIVAGRRKFGRYTLCYRVAQGGMASVYLAQLTSGDTFKKWMAVKIIHPQFASNKKFVAMFLDEAQLAARIDHPNVCSVFDAGEADGTYYLAMEYLHGESLYSVAHRANRVAALPLEIAARIAADAARGLHAAHEVRGPDGRLAEVVHRDVSPHNLFVLYEGVTKVVDFGIARSRDRLAERTEAGELKGKLAYMAPEQLRHQPIDRRTDIFALGVVLWEITLGRRLFKRETEVDTIMAVLRDEIPPPSSVDPTYPRTLEAVLRRALARDPGDRYQTAAELAHDLDVWIARMGNLAGPAEVSEYMRALFADRIVVRDDLLRNDLLRSSGAGPVVPDLKLKTGVSFLPSNTAMAWGTRGARPTLSARQRRYAAGGVGALAALAVFVLATTGPHAPVPAQASPAAGPLIAGVAPTIVPIASEPEHAPTAPPIVTVPAAASDASASTADARATPAHAPRADATVRLPPTAFSSVRTSPASLAHTATSASATTSARGVHAAPASAPPGFLDLVATPSAAVFEGSEPLGVTPLMARSLPPGTHRLVLVPSGGGPEHTIVVQIRSGETHAESVRWP